MSEEEPIPTGMLDAATRALYEKDGHDYAEKDRSLERGYWQRFQGQAEAALRAAGVLELAARIAELEAALRNRICEGCDKLMANVGQLHLCGCDEQRNLCSACKVGCACAGGE